MTENNAKNRMEEVRIALDFFVAAVPPHGYFELELAGLKKLTSNSRVSAGGLNQTAEVCVIALSAYFEAFCKAQFAGVINICPTILRRFIEKRKNTTLDLRNVLVELRQLENKLGNILCEEYDFGSAKSINALYNDLLGITPFSAAESKKYQQFLGDRNLLVHHGGIYTFGYAARRFAKRTAPGLPHLDSLVVSAQDYERWASFLSGMALKIATSSKTALENHARNERIVLSPQQKRAIRFFTPKFAEVSVFRPLA